VDTDGNVTSSSFDKVYTTKEIFKKAVLNTLMGMGTVFVVLIFISFIISLFKYIPNIQAKFAKKAEPVEVAAPAEPAEAFAAQEDDLVDDGELVAVITAAVCAAMACEGNAVSKDGLIVRSIRRSRK
jgi:sodium pump decarboxylase gamma subunit